MFRQDCREIASFSIGGDKFKDSGCAICSVAHIAEQLTGRCYTPRDIKSKCIELLSFGIIEEDFYVNDWARLFNAFGIICFVRREDSSYTCKDNEEEILRLVKTGYTHFVAGDGNGNYSFDSLGRRPAQKDYTVKNKWVIEIKDYL